MFSLGKGLLKPPHFRGLLLPRYITTTNLHPLQLYYTLKPELFSKEGIIKSSKKDPSNNKLNLVLLNPSKDTTLLRDICKLEFQVFNNDSSSSSSSSSSSWLSILYRFLTIKEYELTLKSRLFAGDIFDWFKLSDDNSTTTKNNNNWDKSSIIFGVISSPSSSSSSSSSNLSHTLNKDQNLIAMIELRYQINDGLFPTSLPIVDKLVRKSESRSTKKKGEEGGEDLGDNTPKHFPTPYPYLCNLSVLRKYRGLKLGRILMDVGIFIASNVNSAAKNVGSKDKIYLHVNRDNRVARDIYEDIGFGEITQVCDESILHWNKKLNDGEDICYYVKNINQL